MELVLSLVKGMTFQRLRVEHPLNFSVPCPWIVGHQPLTVLQRVKLSSAQPCKPPAHQLQTETHDAPSHDHPHPSSPNFDKSQECLQ